MHQTRAREQSRSIVAPSCRRALVRTLLSQFPSAARESAKGSVGDDACIESPRALHCGEHRQDLKAATSARSGCAAWGMRSYRRGGGVQGDGASDAVERARHAAKAVLRSQRSPCVAATSTMRNACRGRRTWRGYCMTSFGEVGMWRRCWLRYKGRGAWRRGEGGVQAHASSSDDETGARRGPDGGAGAEHALDIAGRTFGGVSFERRDRIAQETIAVGGEGHRWRETRVRVGRGRGAAVGQYARSGSASRTRCSRAVDSREEVAKATPTRACCLRGSNVKDGGVTVNEDGGGVDVEEAEREQGSGEGSAANLRDSHNNPDPSQKGDDP
ncbi:hypothetical protein B0H13DRAFT_2278996 [Mycena leptocephala]|nr:hypothetical protein B0H13DRAFT_2278996 [Mycena leptocephala]